MSHIRNIFSNLNKKYGIEEIDIVPEHNDKLMNVSALPLVGYAQKLENDNIKALPKVD